MIFSGFVCPEKTPNGMRHRQFRFLCTGRRHQRTAHSMGTRNENESNGVSVYLSVPNANANAANAEHSGIVSKTRRKIMLCTHNLSVFIFIFILLATTYRTRWLCKVVLAKRYSTLFLYWNRTILYVYLLKATSISGAPCNARRWPEYKLSIEVSCIRCGVRRVQPEAEGG